jgi:hypothetical protein
MLALGVAQVREGDFETALFTLDSVVQKLLGQVGRSKDLAKAYLYLGAAYIGLDHEVAAKGKFREALRHDPAIRVRAEEFPPKVLRLFESEQLKLTATKTRRGRKVLLAVAGAGAAGAIGISVAASGPLGNRPPTVSAAVSPEGLAIVDLTTMTLTAIATDPDGDALTYGWEFGDGETASGPTVTHVYNREGHFIVTLTARDGKGGSATWAGGVFARSLNGRWGTCVSGGQARTTYECTQASTVLECIPVDSARQLEAFRLMLADPRRVVGGHIPFCNGDLANCIRGEVATDLNKIWCESDTSGTHDVSRLN